MIEWAFLWKIAEKPLGWIGGPIWRAIQRKRAQILIRGSFGGKLSIMLARLDGDTESGALRETIRNDPPRVWRCSVDHNLARNVAHGRGT